MKKRIQAIMMHRIGGRLGVAKKLLLGIAAVIALSVPVTIGLLSTQQGRAQSGVDTAQAPQSRIPAAVPAAGVPNDQSEPVPFLAQISAIAAIPPQQPADTRSTGPSFEVASVKPTQQCGQVFSSGSGPARSTMVIGKPSFQAGGLYSGCGNLASLIREAYKLDYPFQLSGGPGWKDSDQFQIEAKAEGEPSTDQMRLMVQSLLAERFKLKIHTEMRETQGYSLVVAEGGPRLQQAKDENGNLMTALPPPEVIEAKRKAAMSTPMDFSKMKGGVSTLPGTWGVMGTVKNPPEVVMQFHGSAITLDGLAKFLSGQVGRIVANRTGIPGLYDFQMQFTMDAGTSGNMILVSPAGISRRPTGAPVVAGGEILPAPQFSGPNIFKALEEQYGLKLETGKAPCEYFIIDSAEKPTEN